MDLHRTLERKRPRLGCVALSALLVPSLSCGLGYGIGTIPAPDPMPREPVLATLALERAEAERLGFVFERELVSEHERADPPVRHPIALGAGECVAAIAAVHGSQAPRALSLRRVGPPEQVVSVTESTTPRVSHVQWCAERAESLEVVLERGAVDLYERDGHRAGSVTIVLMRAPAQRALGLRALTRGSIPDEELARMGSHVFDAADGALAPGARPLAALSVERFSARLLPEDAVTYAVLHNGALNGAPRIVRPRFTPLPETAPAAWRPGVIGPRTAEQLRRQVSPTEAPGDAHPAVRETSDGMWRVLAVVDAERLGVSCADLQWVRGLYGYRADVRRARAGQPAAARLRAVDNVAFDRVCRGQGTLVYVAPPTDHAQYTLRIYEGANR